MIPESTQTVLQRASAGLLAIDYNQLLNIALEKLPQQGSIISGKEFSKRFSKHAASPETDAECKRFMQAHPEAHEYVKLRQSTRNNMDMLSFEQINIVLGEVNLARDTGTFDPGKIADKAVALAAPRVQERLGSPQETHNPLPPAEPPPLPTEIHIPLKPKGLLRKGESAQNPEDIAALKKALQFIGHEEVGESTVFNTATYAAVKEVQKEHGLTQDGVVGRDTLAALNEEIKEAATHLKQAQDSSLTMPPLLAAKPHAGERQR